MISLPTMHGNVVIERLANREKSGNAEDTYIVYQDADVNKSKEFSCETLSPPKSTKYSDQDIKVEKAVSGCFGIFFDLGNSFYNTYGGGSTSRMAAVFAQVATLYFNEGISMTMSGTNIWTSQEPFVNNLGSYRDYRNRNPKSGSLNHYVHLLGGGGVAYLRALCGAGGFGYGYGMSGVGTEVLAALPGYSWSTLIIAHELGHNFGSPHTHDCSWNGNNTPIDGCGSTYNGCGISSYIPPNGGTIMSYCHLQSVGTNLALGFGQQPGDRIRGFATSASCKNYSGCGGGGGGTALVCEARVNNGAWQTLSTCAITVSAGQRLELGANPNGLSSYQWRGPNGFSGAGNSDGNILISSAITASQAGDYTVTANINGTTSSKTIRVTVSGGGGGGGSTTCTATFTNTGCQAATLFWNNNGTLVSYGTIAANTTKSQNTYNGHAWVMRVGSTTVGNYTVNCSSPSYSFNAGGCGGGGSTTCTVRFTNTGCQAASLFWNNNGLLVSYGTIAANTSKNQSTYNGHAWVMRVGSTTVGNYTVNCSSPNYSFNSGGCGMVGNLVDGSNIPDGIKEATGFSLYPNPTTGITNLNLESVLGTKDVDIFIYNSIGMRIKQYHIAEVGGEYFQMDLHDLQQGHYMILVNVPGKSPKSVKLVVGGL